jgi:hypothetical protein
MSAAETLIPRAIEPGIYRDMPMSEYLALPLMSASKLEKLRRSPLQYRHALTAPQKKTDALDRGTALHMAILEPLLFDGYYTVAGECAVMTKTKDPKPCGSSGKYLHAELGWLCGTHVKGCGPGLRTDIEIIGADTHDAVMGMRAAILAHPRARTLFEGKGEFESTLVWEEDGVLCKARPDRLIARAGMNVDVKTTTNAEEHAFARQAENMGYWRKLAWYRRGLRALGWPYSTSTLLAVESPAPHDLVPYLIDENDLNTADSEIDRLLRVLRQCETSGEWPGYTTEFATLQRPGWATREETF